MTKQITVRLPDGLVDALDAHIDRGMAANRTDAIRVAVEQLLRAARRRQDDAAIAAGYERHPPTDVETAWADAAGRELIAEEPW